MLPFQRRPFGPCFSHSVSRRQSSSKTMRPVHVSGSPVTDTPCRKVSPGCMSSRAGLSVFRLWVAPVATLATTATRVRVAGVCAAGNGGLERGVSSLSISASAFCTSNHMARTFHDAPAFGPRSPTHNGSGVERHKPPMSFKDAQRSPCLRAFA